MQATCELRLVIISIAIAILASFTLLDLVERITVATGIKRKLWLTGGAMIMSSAIASMYYTLRNAVSWHIAPGLIELENYPTSLLLAIAILIIVAIGLQVAKTKHRLNNEATLVESQRRLATLIDSLPGIVFSCSNDADFSMTYLSEGCLNLTGYCSSELIATKGIYNAITHPEDLPRVLETINAAISGQQPYVVEYRIKTKSSGEYKWLWETGNGVYSDRGQLLGLEGFITDITKLKFSETTTRQAEAKYRSIFENAVEGIFQTTIDGQYISVNPALAKIYGYKSPQALISGLTNIDEQLYVEANRRHEFLELIQQHGVVTGFESQVYRQDRTVIWISENVRVVRDASGDALYYEGTVEDITAYKQILQQLEIRVKERTIELSNANYQLQSEIAERQQAQSALRASEERYRAVVEQTSEGIFLIDACSKSILQTNAAFQKLIGYTCEELLQFKVEDIVAFESTTIEQLLKKQDCFCAEAPHRRKDGSLVWCEANVSCIFYGDRQVFCVIVRDITQRRQAEFALRSSLATNRALIEAIPDLMFRLSSEGIFVNFKASKELDLLVPPQEFLGKHISEVMPAKVAAATMQHISQALATQKIQVFEYQLPLNDSFHDYEARVVVSAENEVMAIVRDITERKRAETEMQSALVKEKELSDLKSRFVNMTSHEFRTPLTTILFSAELIQKYGGKWTQEKKDQHLGRIQTSVNRMTQLLDDVLLIGQAEAKKLDFNPRPIDLNQFCWNLVEEIQNTTDKHKITFTSMLDWTCAEMDEKLLRHIFSNLLTNAIKYTPQGGAINFDLVRQQDQAIFRLQDAGIGIPESDRAQLFDSFHRASNVGSISGTGLGLAIVQKSVKLHGGSISVESEVDVGTTFEVALPLCRDGAEQQLPSNFASCPVD